MNTAMSNDRLRLDDARAILAAAPSIARREATQRVNAMLASMTTLERDIMRRTLSIIEVPRELDLSTSQVGGAWCDDSQDDPDRFDVHL